MCGCLAFGLVLADHSSEGTGVRLPRILAECIEVAAGVLLIAAAVAVLTVLILVSLSVTTYVVPTQDFSAGAARPAGTWNGQNCTVVLIDIAGFGASTRSDKDRRRIRMVLYGIAQSLFEAPDRQHDYHCEDRGDGILLIVPPRVPTGSIVKRILGDMAAVLHQHNSTAEAAARIQMRVALDVGPVVSDAYGVDGLAIIHAARLLDAQVLKRHLAETGTDLGFITSPFVYGTIIQPNPGHVDPAAYQQLKFRVKRQALNAWMYVPRTPDEIQPRSAGGEYLGESGGEADSVDRPRGINRHDRPETWRSGGFTP